MPDLFDEIKEDVQNEKYAKLWKDIGNYVIVGAIAVVASTAGFVGYKNYNIQQFEKQGNVLYGAFSNELKGKSNEAIESYSTLSQEGKAGYPAIANMRKAVILIKEGESTKATGIYKDISEADNSPQEIKELAEILYLQSAIEHNSDPSIINRVKQISQGNGIFRYSAKEMLAFASYNIEEYAEAKKLFEELSNDSKTPSRMKERSNEMLSAINAKQNVGSNG